MEQAAANNDYRKVNVRALPLPAQERVDAVRRHVLSTALLAKLPNDLATRIAEEARQIAANVYEGDHL